MTETVGSGDDLWMVRKRYWLELPFNDTQINISGLPTAKHKPTPVPEE
jgi:hypothetical protein